MNPLVALRSRSAGFVACLLLPLALCLLVVGCGGGATVNNGSNLPVNNADNPPDNVPDNVPPDNVPPGGTNDNVGNGGNTNGNGGNTPRTNSAADTAELARRAGIALSVADKLVERKLYAQAVAAYNAMIQTYSKSVPAVVAEGIAHRDAAQLDAEQAASEALSAIETQLSELESAPEGAPPAFIMAEELLAAWSPELSETKAARDQLPGLRGRYAAERERWMVAWAGAFDAMLVARDYENARTSIDADAAILGDKAAGREMDRLDRAQAANAQLDAVTDAVEKNRIDAAAELLGSVESNEAWSDLPLRLLVDGTPQTIAEYRASVLEPQLRARVMAALTVLQEALARLDAVPPATAAVQEAITGFDPALRALADVVPALEAAQRKIDAAESVYLESLAESVPQWVTAGEYDRARKAIAAARAALRNGTAAGLDALLKTVETAAEADSGAEARMLARKADEDLAHAASMAETGDYAAAYSLARRVADSEENQQLVPERVEAANARATGYLTAANAEASALLDKVETAMAGDDPDLISAFESLNHFPQRLKIAAETTERLNALSKQLLLAINDAVRSATQNATALAEQRYYSEARESLAAAIDGLPAPGQTSLLELDATIKREQTTYLARAGREPLRPADDAGMHAAFDRLLRTYVDDHGLVSYDGMAANVDMLDAYLDQVARTDPTALGRSDRLALWINAYNAFTLRLVVRNRASISSIRDVPDAWSRAEWAVNGTTYSLDQIEHDQIRAAFNEPRVHAALVCGARSCPPLQAGAYVGSRLDAQLNAAMRRFLADDTRGAAIAQTRAGTELRLSKVFEWFIDDFGGNQATLLQAIKPHLPADVRDAVNKAGSGLVVSWLEYDWSLNGQQQ